MLSVTVFAFAGCNGGSSGALSLSSNMFDGFRVVFPDDTSHLGLVRRSPQMLTAFDPDGSGTQVYFVSRYDENDNVITQTQIEAEFGKLYITAEFVYFTMTTQETTRVVGCEEYDRTKFVSDASTQSFLIDRENNNIYSLAIFSEIYRIYRNTIMIERSTLAGGGAGMTVLKLEIEFDTKPCNKCSKSKF